LARAKYEYSIPYFDQAAFTGNDSLVQAASYYLGRMHLKNDNLAYANNAFEKAATFDFDPEIQEESFFALAKLKFDSRMRGQSIPLLQKYIDDYPEGKYSGEANQYLSEAFLTSNNFDAAIQHIEGLESKNRIIRETYQKVTFYKGVELFNDRQFELANTHFDKSLSEPLSKDFVALAYFWKGESLSILQKFSEAINSYAGVFRNEDNFSSELFLKTRYGIAYAYFNTRQYDKALTHFNEYVKALAPTKSMYYDDALVRLADCYLVLKKNDLAYNTYLKSLKSSDEERDYTLYRLGVVSWFKGNKKEAQKYLGMVLTEYKDSRYFDDALYEFANIDFENSDFNNAIKGFSRLIDAERISPFLPYAYLNRGISFTNIDKPEKAIEDYRVILKRFASHKTAIDALTGLQEALNLTGRDDEYEKDKALFAAANPESDALVALDYEGARKHYFSGDYQKAAQKFKDYLDTYGRNQYYGDINYYLAESYYLLNKSDSALKYHKEVLQSTNSNFLNKSILRAGDIQYDQGEYREAIPNYNLLRHLARSRSEEIFAWQGLMLSHYEIQHYDTAMSFAKLITDRGEAAFGARNLALLYLGKSARNLEKFDEAESYFNECIEAGEDVNAAEALFNIAEMRSRLGDYQKSIDMSLDLISRFSHYPEWNDRAFLLIAENFFLMEEYFQSRSTLESIIANSPNVETVRQAKELLAKVAEKEVLETEKVIENDTIE
jgi:TolA-binding protein